MLAIADCICKESSCIGGRGTSPGKIDAGCSDPHVAEMRKRIVSSIVTKMLNQSKNFWYDRTSLLPFKHKMAGLRMIIK